MDRPIELVPLICPRCSTHIPAELDEVAWACSRCDQGLLLDLEKGLVAVEIFYSAAIASNARGRPFWVADGTLSLARQSYDSADKQTREAEMFWAQPRRFFIPAFTSPLEERLNLAASLLLQPPEFQPGPPVAFEPVTLLLQDVQSAAEFVVVALEAGRKDHLRELDLNLKLSPPLLWILP